MMLGKWISISACTVGIAVNSVAFAQQTTPKAPPQAPAVGTAKPSGDRAHWQSPDQTLATCVAIGNQEEIAIAKFAAERAKSSDVKEFAKMLVKDHQEFLQKLERFAPEASREGYLMENREKGHDRNRTTSTSPRAGESKVQVKAGDVQVTAGKVLLSEADAADVHHGHSINFVQLHRELAEECIRNSKEMLGEKEGTKFDECFIGYQIAAHAAMKTKLSVFERHASADLKEILEKGRETTERHLKKAEGLMKDLAQSDSDEKSSKTKGD